MAVNIHFSPVYDDFHLYCHVQSQIVAQPREALVKTLKIKNK